MLCITGSPRSGTRYVARLLGRAGIDVPHERMGSEGIVHSLWAVDDTLFPWKAHAVRKANKKNRDSYRWMHRWHQTRHPLHVIPSVEARFRRHTYFWPWQKRHTGVSPDDPFRAARFWLAWTDIADQWCDHRYRVEDLAEEWDGMVEVIGHRGASLHHEGLESCNGIPHETIEWSDLGPCRDQVMERAQKYGYEVES